MSPNPTPTKSLQLPAPPRRGACTTPVPPRRLTASDINRGFRFGSILFSAMAALASIALGLWFARFVSIALERQDWVGWLAFGLMMIIAVALAGIVLRELIGFRRLARLAESPRPRQSDDREARRSQ